MIEIYKNKKICLLAGVVGISISLIVWFTGRGTIAIVVGAIFLLTSLLNQKFAVFVLLFLQLGLTQSTTGLTKIEIVFLMFFSCGVIGWILPKLLKKKIVIKHSSLNFPIFLFLTLCIFSFVKASYNNINIIEWFMEWRVFLVIILFFIIMSEFKSKEELKWLIYSFLLITVLICLRDIFLAFLQGSIESSQQVAGIQYTSIFFIMNIPLSIAIFLGAKNLWLKWIQIPLILLFIFRLSISLMRSYILALLMMLTIFIVTSLTLKSKKMFFRMIALITLICIISGAVFLIFPIQIHRISQNYMARFMIIGDFYSPQNISILSRIAEIKAVWSYALQQPLLGHGFGFKYQYYRPNQKFYDISYVHFVPLFFVLKIGFIGIIIVTWLITKILMLNWQVFKKEKDLFWKLLELALFSNFIGFVILSFFISFIRIDSLFYFTLATGIIGTIKKIQKESNIMPRSSGAI